MPTISRLDAALGPPVALLDPRDSSAARAKPISGSVNIPAGELARRTHELPPRKENLLVADVGSEARTAIDWLHAHGRIATILPDYTFGEAARARLWRPNSLIECCVPTLSPGRALDLACGTGRDAVALAALGWDVVGVDLLPDAVERARDLASRYLADGGMGVEWRVADLERSNADLGAGYDLVTMFFYYVPGIVERAAGLLQPGGSLMLETFTPTHREAKGRPSASRVLNPEQLPAFAAGLEIRLLDSEWRGDRHTVRMWARRAGPEE
jgi:SAM-dependent methyltransferase